MPTSLSGPSKAGAAAGRAVPPRARVLADLAAVCSPMQDLATIASRLGPTDLPLALVGEPGVGKARLARIIHEISARAAAAFDVFDCRGLNPAEVGPWLFGDDVLASGQARREGAFQRAAGGTLFLTDVAELPLPVQGRLLRVLEGSGPVMTGGDQVRRTRLLTATTRSLPEAVAAGTFRRDLYIKLAPTIVTIPPLRERIDDLPVLVPRLMQDLGRADVTVAPACLRRLAGHSWPGNVRELRDVLACALALVEEGSIEAQHIRFAMAEPSGSALDRLPLGGVDLARIEMAAIRQTLAQTGGNKVQAARVLGIATSTLYEKLKKYGFPGADLAPTPHRK